MAGDRHLVKGRSLQALTLLSSARLAVGLLLAAAPGDPSLTSCLRAASPPSPVWPGPDEALSPSCPSGRVLPPDCP